MIFKWIYILGRNFRNPSSKVIHRFLNDSQNYTLNQLENFQLNKLKELVGFAYQHSEFYRKAFDEKQISPSDINTLSDLQMLPIITKNELITQNSNIHTNFKFKNTFEAKTSGTSGASLVFKRNEYCDSFNRTVINHNYSIYGVKPWDRNGYFWGFNTSLLHRLKTRFFDVLQNRFRVFSYSTTELNQFIRKLNSARYIHGYSSSIYETAKAINQGNTVKPSNILMVKGTSEKIFDYYQPEIKKAFGTKMISEYGAAETGIIAFECPHGNMHINMEGVIVEELNNEILVTNLHMLSFPIIRYRLGDYIKLASRETSCPCGKEHLVLIDVLGRIGETVYGIANIYPSLYFYYIFKNLSENYLLHLEYQVVQKKRGHLIFNISSHLTDTDKKLLVKEIENYFKNDMQFIIKSNTIFEPTEGKKKSFISSIHNERQ
ncbi:phenylacetate-CoA ligase [Gelidibacter algens]|uniref:Phenylacetate-CoA ligase n=1 Tax=Gelidibacter algens TaxID=49280 RepID=A0A1A7QRG8_9FLAO|nr:phenylacetate--CoA ligase family protein [Gelidibacter algens]OBX22630.1 capsule biosynthesis protein CapK [Gelidibacter algens]RAJ24374.1 phenylacetate-CoA ligase [Gelidibacter algens]